MNAALADGEIHIHGMRHAAVIPHQNIADAPAVVVLVFRLGHVGVDAIE